MRLTPLYRLHFNLTQRWVSYRSADGVHIQAFRMAEGRCEGGIAGVFRGTHQPDLDRFPPLTLQGVIETEDAAAILITFQGFGSSRVEGGYQIVGTVTHSSGSEAYRWLNSVVCAVTGEVRRVEGEVASVVFEVEEMSWEPLS